MAENYFTQEKRRKELKLLRIRKEEDKAELEKEVVVVIYSEQIDILSKISLSHRSPFSCTPNKLTKSSYPHEISSPNY